MDPLESEQWYDDDTYYQILLVTPPPDKIEGQYIKATIVAKKREEFKKYLIDHKSQDKLKAYPRHNPSESANNIGSYLPSPGAVLAPGFKDVLLQPGSPHPSIELNNFYGPIQTLLQTRKISQLIAKTWYMYLQAKEKNHPWNNFVNGQWHDIDSDILDGLIAREIFFFDQISFPEHIESDNLKMYNPLHSNTKPSKKARFLILPNSKGWQGISLSLLMAGQAYYQVNKENQTYYHQISQPILSTGDITLRYELEVDWNRFKGDIKELQVVPGKYSVSSKAIVPYPPIPSERNLPCEDIKKWAEAEDEGGELPFYYKQDGKYLVDVQYFSPPYPYLPLSTC
ncbi:hypothetical protein H6G95_19320 [Nostoc linckia FACHB-391]|uniref:Uncharacterized protein n=3 Tax=Nostoc TaxID=1177 RepID=A0ABR8IC05_9NOSO|nr:hypothetical protein [Nostoc linckia FACHB-391]MBD2648347.1 hypothetical protein [Nostoc foliaceum FACHB-393]